MPPDTLMNSPQGGKVMVGEGALRNYLDKWDNKYWTTYKVLDILQKLFYRSNPAREAFVEMCDDYYVQKMTFDSYLYKVGAQVLASLTCVWSVGGVWGDVRQSSLLLTTFNSY